MEKSKVFFGVLAAGLAVSLAGNLFLWNAASQWGAEYTAAIAYLEGQVAKSRENQNALRQELEQTKADLERAERDLQTLKTDPNDPFAGMTEEDLMKELLDTSDAPGKADLDKLAEDAKKNEQGGGQGGQSQGGQSQGQTGGQGQSGTSGLTPEQKAELDRIMESLGGWGDGTSRGEAPGGNIGDSYTGPGIDWNK